MLRSRRLTFIMDNGRVTDLKEAIRVMAKNQLTQDLSSTDVDVIYAFLISLTGEMPNQIFPKLSMTPGTTLTPEQWWPPQFSGMKMINPGKQ
jgi:hypothetical protein